MEGIIGPLGRRGIPLVGLSSEPKCTAFHSKYLTQRLLSPDPRDEEEFLAFLIEKAPRGVLLTSNDQTAVLFARHASLLREQGFLVNVPPLATLLGGFDKWQCYQNAGRLGVPAAESLLIETEEDALAAGEQLGYPHIIKATRLAGGNYRRIDERAATIPAFRDMQTLVQNAENRVLEAGLIAQKWLEYQVENIWCVEAYYDTQGRGRGFWPIRKWRTVIYRDGTYGSRLYAGECLEHEELENLSRRLLDGLGWRGFAHIDWVYLPDEKRFCLTEINPRLPGFSFFPCHAGFDMAYFYYADLAGHDYEVPPLEPSVYLEVLRHPGDFTSTLMACARGQYSFRRFVKSYVKALLGRKKVVVDYFEVAELRRTVLNCARICWSFQKELLSLVKAKLKSAQI